jgi:2-polyprenyl-6-methoxyphenol hydroxylase-like FAD-dependent oxidoreductase
VRAAIVGAGTAGLVAARQLGFAGWRVDVFERSAGPNPSGYMMDFFGPGFDVAERIGILPRLKEVSYRVDSVEYVDSEWRPTARLNYGQFYRVLGGRLLSLMRRDLERVLLAAVNDDVPASTRRREAGGRPSRRGNLPTRNPSRTAAAPDASAGSRAAR